jgi:ATP-dependent Clp protease ATP-binding subunit ClpA
VTRAVIEDVLREQYGVQVGEHETIDPGRVATELRAALIGQDDAVAEVERALAAQVNRKDKARRPVAILMFAGPSGVGKIFVVEALTEVMFGNAERTLFRCNMNEFKSVHEMARLVGAPPGYVGHEQYGSLFRYVGAQPRGVILLDEMDKAHPEIQDYFLQIFDKGEARDSRGRVADFTQHLFILTCNTAGEGAAERGIGFRAQAEKARAAIEVPIAELLQYYRRELLARIDRIVAFKALAGEDYRQVLAARIGQLARELNEQGVALQVDEAAQAGFCDACVAQKEGVRGFNKLYEQMWLAPLSRYLEAHPEAQTVHITWPDDRLSFA